MPNEAGDDSSPVRAPKRRRWLGLLLAVSLGVNMLFVGLALSAFWHLGSGGMMWASDGMRGGDISIRDLHDVLPDSLHDLAHTRMKEREGALFARIAALREARRSVTLALEAEAFDPSRLERAFGDMRRISSELRGEAHALFVALAARMSAEERARAAEGLRRYRPPFHHRGRNWRERR